MFKRINPPVHLTLKKAYSMGFTLSQWIEHEQAAEAVDALIQDRRERLIIGLTLACAVLSFSVIMMLGA